jgi:hypothetical protein
VPPPSMYLRTVNGTKKISVDATAAGKDTSAGAAPLGSHIMRQDAFGRGYTVGWQSVRGSIPSQIPEHFEEGEKAYRAGVAQGVHDGCAQSPDTEAANLEEWLDRAVRRSLERR